jgi:hypothetical protein
MRSLFLSVIIVLSSLGFLQSCSFASVVKGARIFVPKVHPAHGDLTKDDFKQLADAGFTVIARKWTTTLQGKPGISDGEYAARAASVGLSVMKFQSGLVEAKDDADQTINRNGVATRYTRPQSLFAWQALTDEMVAYAKLSKIHPNIEGINLDFEIYDHNKTDGFCESYDDQTFRDFFASVGRDAPDPLVAPKDRQQYLIRQQMYQMYIGYQIDLIAQRAVDLRKAIDAINPKFQIGIYGWGVLIPPIIHAMATPQAPALILSAMTYGRSVYSNAFESGYDAQRSDDEALKWSLETVQKGIAGAHQRYDNVIYLAGHYPQSPGPKDQYKFTAKQAFQSAAFGEGYWIWTDWKAPKPWTNKREWYDAMMEYFGKANAALDAKNWKWAENEPPTVK